MLLFVHHFRFLFVVCCLAAGWQAGIYSSLRTHRAGTCSIFGSLSSYWISPIMFKLRCSLSLSFRSYHLYSAILDMTATQIHKTVHYLTIRKTINVVIVRVRREKFHTNCIHCIHDFGCGDLFVSVYCVSY